MKSQQQSVKIGDIFYNVLKNKKLIIILTIVGLISGMMITSVSFIRGEMSKKYKIDTSILVTVQTKSGSFSNRTSAPKKEDMDLAVEMTDAAMFVIRSDSTISDAIKKLEMVGVPSDSIKNNLTLTKYEETQIIEVSLLWRNEEEGKKIVNTLVEVSETALLNTMKIGNISIITQPSATYILGGEINLSVLIYAAIGGMFIGIAFCVLKLLSSPTIIRAEDVEKLYGVELLGSLAFDKQYAESTPYLIEPESSDVEITSIADVLMNRMNQAGIKSCFITSIKDGEGKTKILADLAMKISEFGKKVLIVDCDFNSPSLVSHFNINVKYENSLNALYNGDCDKVDAVIKINGCLSILSSILFDKPISLTLSMLELIKDLYSDYDYILFDAGAIGKSSNVIRLNEISEVVVVVVKFDNATMDDIRRSFVQLSKSGISVAGCIVNGTKTYKDILFNVEKRFLSKSRIKNRNKMKKKQGNELS